MRDIDISKDTRDKSNVHNKKLKKCITNVVCTMIDEVTKNEIFSYIERVAEELNIFNYEIKFSVVQHHFLYGGGGILANIHVNGTDYGGTQIQMDFCMKMSDDTSIEDHVRKAYKREIFFYTYIVPYIHYFLRKHSPDKTFNLQLGTPRCHKTFTTENREVLIFNRIADIGYKRVPSQFFTDQNVTTSILKCLATLHAVTFTIQFEKSGEFLDIVKKWLPEIKDVFLLSNIENHLKTGVQMALDMLVEENRDDIRNQLLIDTGKGTISIIDNVLSNVPTKSVLIHGDVLLRNVYVLYEKNNPTVPKDVKFIYWHLATLHSPVLDLSYFLYLSYSEDIHVNYEKYVEYYYNEFTNVLVKLGTDPAKFPFQTLLDHLKTYSIMPLVVALGGIPLIILDEQMNVDVEEYHTMHYCNLREDVKNLIKAKLLGILELHYKYFGE